MGDLKEETDLFQNVLPRKRVGEYQKFCLKYLRKIEILHTRNKKSGNINLPEKIYQNDFRTHQHSLYDRVRRELMLEFTQ